MSSKGALRSKVGWTLANVDVDNVARSLERGDQHPGVIPEIGYEVAATGSVFWVSESGRVHQTWITTLTRVDPGKPYSPLVAHGDVGCDPFVAGSVVQQSPARGWGRGLPWKVPWEGSASEGSG